MAIQTEFEQISLKSKPIFLSERQTVEQRTNLLESDVQKILWVEKKASCSYVEALSGQVKYGGTVVFTVIYLDGNNEIKKAEYGTEFSNKLSDDNILEGAAAQVKFKVVKTDCTLSNGAYVIKAVIVADVKVENSVIVNALSQGELTLKKEEKPLIKSYGLKRGVFPVEEEFSIGYEIKEVLSHEVLVITSSAQCGIGSIIVDGEILLSLSLLQNIQNSDIIKCDKHFPFRLELECEEATPTMNAIAKAVFKDVKLNVVVDEAAKSSTVSSTVNISLSGEAFEEYNVEVVSDAYSTDKEIVLEKTACKYDKPLGLKCFERKFNLNGKVKPALDSGLRLMCAAVEDLTILNAVSNDGSIKVEGVIEAVAFNKDIDGNILTTKFEAPFETVLDAGLKEGEEFSVEGFANILQARFISLSETEFEVLAKFIVTISSTCSAEFITTVKELGDKIKNDNAISVYIPLEGEDLWTVSKRLGASPEEIMALNSDLKFPLSGEERILIYRQDAKSY